MNIKSFKTLEFNKIKQMLSEIAFTEGSKNLALSLEPSTDIDIVRLYQNQTDDAKKLMIQKGTPTFNSVKDISSACNKAQKEGILSTRELLQCANVLSTTRLLIDYYKTDKLYNTVIDEIFERLIPIKSLEDNILSAIISEDIIADNASFELADIRHKIKKSNSRITELIQKYVSGGTYSKYLQENIATTRNGRFVLPVKSEYRNQIQGLVHDTSSSGATLFIEPIDIVQANNDIKELESREKFEIERILSELSAKVSINSEKILLNYDNITLLSFVFSKAELAYRLKATKVEINDNHTIELEKARHPLISGKVVPITVSLGNEYQMLIITGPNTGGKTVTLKTIGLFVLMAQSGLQLPCEKANTCVFKDVYSDIGDEQSIEQSLSTFSSHMVNIVDILNNIHNDTLVLLDELCSGTDPIEGAALAHSILEEVMSSGALCAATTHYAELKAYAIEREKVVNASCEFDVNTLKPTYRLIVGTPGKSNAFSISTKLGLSNSIVNRAEKFINSDSQKFEDIISKLDQERYTLEAEKEKALEINADLERIKQEEKDKLQNKYDIIDKEIENAKKEAKKIIDSARATSDYVLKELDKAKKAKDSSNFGEKLSSSKSRIRESFKNYNENNKEEQVEDNYVLPRPLKKGDSVQHKSLKTEGMVIDVDEKKQTAMVQMGILKSRFEFSDLILLENASKIHVSGEKNYRNTVRNNFKPTLDVRGMYGDDAVDTVDKYIDEALVAKVYNVTILHGKGTGVLRNAIWNFLKKDKRIASYRAGQYGEGDYGVTIVEIKHK